MVAIIENYAGIEGKIVGMTDHPTREGYLQMKLALKKSKTVEGFPNLAQADEGTTIHINVKKEAADQLAVTKSFSGVVRKAPGQEYFIK
ncbi:MAG: hypothetical protein ABIU63_10850 [Chitinophagaceae bacterium]